MSSPDENEPEPRISANLANKINLFTDLTGWRMAGHGCFLPRDDGVLESEGGPGLFWFTAAQFGDFVLEIDWRIQALTDNSGVFIRTPSLGSGNPDTDWCPAVERGYEIQIDDRGYDPERKVSGSELHRSGAIYRLAPAGRAASLAPGRWNRFRIVARGSVIRVELNGLETARLEDDVGRLRCGHVGLQCHHQGSRVQFRRLGIERLE